VIPIFLPIYQDAVLAKGYKRTLKAQFIQIRRWAWGATDIAYVAKYGFFKKNKISKIDVWFKFLRLLEGHFSWATAPLILAFGGRIGVTFLAALIAAVMTWELSRFFYHLPDKVEKTKALVGISWLSIFTNMLFPKSMLESLVFFFIGLFMYFLATADRHADQLQKHFNEFVFTVFTLVYVVVFISFFPLLRESLYGGKWVFLFFLIVWSGDTGAYFIGIRYGRNKLYPLISPGKSMQGAAGGLCASIFVALLFKAIGFREIGWGAAFCTALIVGGISQIGDLCESFLKRAYHIKDSSQILPGHGGFLDRFDGVLFSLPVMYFCAKMFS
jgi:phosphatidate cytidylyltransferase